MSLKRSEFGCRIVFRCSFLPDNCSRIEREREKKNWFRVRKESGSAKKDVGWMAGRIRRNSVLLGNQLYRPCMRVIGRIWTLIRTIGEGRGRDASFIKNLDKGIYSSRFFFIDFRRSDMFYQSNDY